MNDLFLTPAQEDAAGIARRAEDACIVAGPGSGKTTVLVEYFRRLVADAGVDPQRILAITFTEKAAGNMRKKLGEQFRNDPERRAALERAWVSTVHGFCARLLRENAVFAGVDPEFRVADALPSWRMQQESLGEVIDALLDENAAGMRSLIRGLSSYEFDRTLLNAYDTMRGAGIGVEQLTHFPAPGGVTLDEVELTLDALRNEDFWGWSPDQKAQAEGALEGVERILSANSTREELAAVAAFSVNLNKCKRSAPATILLKKLKEKQIPGLEYTLITELYSRERELLMELMRRFDRLYREKKRSVGVLDFSDLEEYSVRLLESQHETRARLQRQFEHILMDEFQDTNGQQAKLLKLIRPVERFYAVGDINQSIFGFRHAEPSEFKAYREDVAQRDRRLVELTENFRSRAHILSAVETVTANLPGIVQRPLVAARKFEDAPDHSVEVIVAATEEIEAQCVARRILEMSSFAFRDFAVLVRNTSVIPAFTKAFDDAGVPYVVNQGRGFYTSRDVLDLTHLLRVIANPRDEISLAVVLRSPLVGAGDEDLLRLRIAGGTLTSGLFACDGPPRLVAFRDRLRQWRARREYVTFDALLAEAIDDCGYPASPNVVRFLTQARDEASRVSLDQFVAELAMVRKEDPRDPHAPPEDASNTVKVMTVHAAKGLEFPVVFVAGLHKGVDTATPVIGFSRHVGLGARWRNPATGKDKSDIFLHALSDEWKQREAEESSRLLYVAMTRAEKHLALSFALGERRPSKWDKVVAESLGLDLAAAADRVEEKIAPDGKPWSLRYTVALDPPELLVRQRTGEETAAAETEILERPEVTAQHDANATVTALAKFASCPRQYFLGMYLGYEGRRRSRALDEEDSEGEGDLAADELGTQVHALLAGLDVIDPDPEAVRLAEVFDQSPLGARAARATRKEREFDFLMALEDLVVRGQVDLWFEEGGELVVVDYKTDDVRGPAVQERAGDYSLQLRLYAMAVERLTGRAPDRAYLHFLRPDRIVEVDLGPSLLESPEQVVKEFAAAQGSLQFPLNEGERCRRCPFYKGLCPAAL